MTLEEKVELYPLIYNFLQKLGYLKTCKRLKTETELTDKSLRTANDLSLLYSNYKARSTSDASAKLRDQHINYDSEEVEDEDDVDDDEDEEDEDEDEEDEDDDDEEERKAAERARAREKERLKKAAEAAKASAEWAKRASASPATSSESSKKRKIEDKRAPNEAFRRVDSEVWSKEIIAGLEDNSYEKSFGSEGYGAKASAKLMQVRGKDFRHEKTKKKRGSYRGGSITMASYSFKYDD